MPIPKTAYKVILASPSDVISEREIVSQTIIEVNEIFKDSPVFLQLIKWETDVNPSFHPKGPQGLIDDKLNISDSDLLIGIFFMRFGTKIYNEESGTVHEINQAIKSFEQNNKPEIKLYFKKPISVNLEKISNEQYKQYNKIKKFRENVKLKGIICEFDKEEVFKSLLQKHLINFLNSKKEEIYTSRNDKNENTQSEEIINCKNEEEFIRAIGPNKTIVLEPRDYIISKVKNSRSDFIEWEEEFDGYQLIIKNLSDLRIFGDKNNRSRIIVEPRYADVLIFKNVNNIFISHIEAGHAPKKGSCVGKVFSFYDSNNIFINNSILFGSGTEGLFLHNVNNFNFKYSIIEKCTEGILTILNSKSTLFKKSTFRNNELWGTINIEYFSDVKFIDCDFYKNYCNFIKEYDLFQRALIDVSPDTNVQIINSRIYNNTVEYLANNKKYIDFYKTEIKGNIFLNNHKRYRY